MTLVDSSLLSYIPIDRRHALIRDIALPDRATGAALFADISGFTPLTEALALALGPQRGAEELTLHLNDVFSALITEVERYGGSVVSFSGDAITCWFDQDTGLRATASALAMQAAMRGLATVVLPRGAGATLAMRVAVATGPVRRFVVGDPTLHRIDVLAGHTLDTLAAIDHLAQPGEVLLDAHTAAFLGEHLRIAEWREHSHGGQPGNRAAIVEGLQETTEPTAWPTLPGATLSEDQIRPWLLPAVYERLRQGADQFLADLRPAVALFLSFSGIDYDEDDDAGILLDAYIRRAQATLAQYEGSLLHLSVGDKGSYLYAAFGAPLAHDDDAARAVGAALELRMPPAHLGYIMDVCVGLAQGQMYTGAYGSLTRRTYGVQGDKANLAARLMQQATAGEILCDDEVYRQAHRRWAFETLSPIRVKGKAGLIRVYRPTGPLAAAGVQPTRPEDEQQLIGRTAEVARLQVVLDDLQIGHGRVLFIEGEAGIGKSRLAEELVRMVREQGLTGLLGAGRSIEQQTPYRAWRDILTSFFDLEAVTDPVERQMHVQHVVQELVPKMSQRLPLLNDLLPLDLPDTALTAALDPGLRQESLTGLLIALLRAWTRERPLILLLEDAHWLDSVSWNLTMQVARALLMDDTPLLLIVVNRPLDEQSVGAHALANLRDLIRSETLELGALSSEETVALATNRLGLSAGALPESVALLVRERSGGNPFFAEELAYMMRDRGLIKIEIVDAGQGAEASAVARGRCVVSPDLASASSILPDTLQGLILARIDQLPLDRQFTLKVAAVIGRTFTYIPLRDTLNLFTAINDLALRTHLDELTTRDLTLLDMPEPELSYIFRHIITQEVAYQTLLFAQRKQIHRAVAEWYEARLRQDEIRTGSLHSSPSFSLPLLVHHYHYAEEVEKECYYARLAGEQAAKQYANAEAIRYLSRALDLTPEHKAAMRFDLLLEREKVYDLQGSRERQLQDLVALEALAKAMDDSGRQAEAALRQAAYGYHMGDYAVSIMAAERAVDLAVLAGATETEASARLLWGSDLWQQAEYAAAHTQIGQALSLAQRAGLGQIEADCLRQQGVIYDTQAEYPAARAALEQALQLYRDISDQRGEARSLNSLGVVAYDQNDYAAAHTYYNLSLQIKHEMGDRYGQGVTLQNLGLIAVSQGDLLGARSYFQQALSICREIGDREGEASAFEGLSTMALRLGDYAAAHSHIQHALQISREIGERINESVGLTYLSMIFQNLGDAETALHHSLESLRIAQEIGARHYEASAWRQLGDVRLGLGHPTEATDAFQKALNIYRELNRPQSTVDPLEGLARAALALGANAEALAYVEAILDLLRTAPSDGAGTPVRTYLTCYHVLRAISEPRAHEILERAHLELQTQANRIDDLALRHTFLENVPWHRELITTWEKKR